MIRQYSDKDTVETPVETVPVSNNNDKSVSGGDKPVEAKGRNRRRRRYKGNGTLQQEKTGIWTVRAWINGKRTSKSTGTTDRAEAEKFLTEYMRPYVKGDAARMYDNIQALVESDEKRAERKEDEKPQMTIAAAFDAYSKSPMRRDLAEATLEGKRLTWNHWAKWMRKFFKEVTEVRQVERKHVEAFLDYLRKDHAASTYNNRLCVIREMFRVIGPAARCKRNPWDGIPLRADDSHSRRELTVEELKRLIECATRVGDEYRKLFAIGVYTGLRLGDCCRLNWKNVDVVRSIIQLIPSKTKKYAHGKPVTIPVHPVLSAILQETPVLERVGFVIPTVQATYAKSRPKLSYQIKKIFNAAGIVTSVSVEGRAAKAPEATFHSFRHTFVSLSANAGVPLHIVQSIVGHESTTMTRHYYHENEAALRQAVAAIPTIGETAVKDSPLPFCHAPTTPALPDSMQSFDRDKGTFIEVQPSEPAELPAPVARPIDTAIGREPTNAADPVVHPQVGGVKARPKPPKAQWMGECMRLWGHRRATGVLEGTMSLVKNGGYVFLQELWDRGAGIACGEALDMMEAFLCAKGIKVR